MIRKHITLPNDLDRWIEGLSAITEKSTSDIIRQAINEYKDRILGKASTSPSKGGING
jgi:predicted transcriptional regulator